MSASPLIINLHHTGVKVKVWSHSGLSDSATPWTVAYQVPPSMGFSRQEYWSGLPFPSPIQGWRGNEIWGQKAFSFAVHKSCPHEATQKLIGGNQSHTTARKRMSLSLTEPEPRGEQPSSWCYQLSCCLSALNSEDLSHEKRVTRREETDTSASGRKMDPRRFQGWNPWNLWIPYATRRGDQGGIKADLKTWKLPLGAQHNCVKCEVAQSCPTLCDPVDCSSPGSSVHGILQARVLEWVAISFSRASSQPRDRTQVSCIAGRRFILWATREAPLGRFLKLRRGTGELCQSDTMTEKTPSAIAGFEDVKEPQSKDVMASRNWKKQKIKFVPRT